MASLARLSFWLLSILVALFACTMYQHCITDERLNLPFMYSHVLNPIKRILPKIMNNEGTAFLDAVALSIKLRDLILDNKPPLELETLYEGYDGRGEILRYKRTRDRQKQEKQIGRKKGALVYIHGGAYVFGSPEGLSGSVAEFETHTGKEMFFIRYRLAPEHPFPAAVEDCTSMVRWLFDNSGELDIDRNDIQLFGDSAGGNLVTLVAIELLEKSDMYPIRGVHAIYPWYNMLYDLPSAYEFSIDPAGVSNQEDLPRFMVFYLFGDNSCAKTKILNKHLTDNVQNRYKTAVKELGIESYVKSAEDKIEKMKSTMKQETDKSGNEEHEKCAMKYEQHLLNYRNDIVFTPPEKLKLLGKTKFNLYSCEVDILRDDTYTMVAMLESLNISHKHAHIENCYHASFNDNTHAGKILQGKVVENMNSL